MTITLKKLAQVSSAVLVGAGREGRSTYHYLRQHYPELRLTIADQQPPEKWPTDFQALIAQDDHTTAVSDENYLDCLTDVELIFKSPGVPPHLPPLQMAEQNGVVISSNAQLFFELTTHHTRIGITGTKGKSTTTALIHHVLQQAGMDVHLLGNIGTAPLSILRQDISPNAIFVIELSSYQLHDMRQSPEIAVLQNIVPEHLTWHGTFESYVDDKTNITRFQTDNATLIFNEDYPLPSKVAAETAAKTVPFGLQGGVCTVQDDWLVINDERVIAIADVPLHGAYNLVNVMPALVIGRQLGLSNTQIADAIRTFETLEHRMQYVDTVNNVRYYNDSLATVPEATIAAIEGFRPAGVVLITGGYDREIAYDVLATAILQENIRHLVLFPTTGERILNALRAQTESVPTYDMLTNMQDAVAIAAAKAQPGDVVLLSPASASFNLFKDYRDRGEQFMQAVKALHERQ